MAVTMIDRIRNFFRGKPPKPEPPKYTYDASTDEFVKEMTVIRKESLEKARYHQHLATRESANRKERGNPIADAAFPPRGNHGRGTT